MKLVIVLIIVSLCCTHGLKQNNFMVKKWHRTAKEAVDSFQDDRTITYLKIVKSKLLPSLLVVSLALPVAAKIPTFDDYSSSKPATSNAVATPIKLKEMSADVKDAVLNLDEDVRRLSSMVDNNEWDVIVSQYKRMKPLQQKYFGKGNKVNLASALSISDNTAEELNSMREELSTLLLGVSDVAVQNRVYFFNRDDLSQVQMLQESEEEGGTKMSTDYEEPRRLLAEAKEIAEKMKTLLQ